MCAERILQATGNTVLTMVSQCIGALINIALDPILIFGLLGMPRMGTMGAAIATVTGQIIACAVALYFNFKFNHEIHMDFRRFRPSSRIIGEIARQGFPCLFHLLTGLYCPGCGGTRAFRALLAGNLLLSIRYHPLVAYMAVVLTAELVSFAVSRACLLYTSRCV